MSEGSSFFDKKVSKRVDAGAAAASKDFAGRKISVLCPGAGPLRQITALHLRHNSAEDNERKVSRALRIIHPLDPWECSFERNRIRKNLRRPTAECRAVGQFGRSG